MVVKEKMRIPSEELMQKIVNYLNTCPHGQVRNLVDEIMLLNQPEVVQPNNKEVENGGE